jgi:PAS domain S-box-containing protein
VIVETIAPLVPEELLQILNHAVGSTISVFGRDLRFRYVNEGFAKAFNLTPQEMVGMPLSTVYGEVHHEDFLPNVNRALAGETVTYERLGRMLASAGVWRTVSLTPWRNAQGEVIGVVSASLQVHELKVSTEALRAANERLSSHMDNSPLAVLELDANLNITRCSRQITKMLGLDPHAMTGQALMQALAIGANQESFQLAFARLQTGQETRNRVESSHLHADGATPVYCEWFNSALTGADGQVTSIMSLVEDVSVRVRATEQLRDIARHDMLTGLLNRSALIERLTGSLMRAQRTQEPVALLFLDLDGFKHVNDDFGHSARIRRGCALGRRRVCSAAGNRCQ